jgi:O-antigen/teichoic acid export membrane protein
MDKKAKLIVVKNALANVIRGGAAALVAIALPPFLTRLMSPGVFSVWALVLQLSAFVGYLDFGIQTAVGRFVALANERRDAEHRDRIVNTSLAVLSATCILCILGTGLLAVLLPRFFSQMPSVLVGDARVALMLVAASLAIGLPASVITGIFVGLQRNEVPAAIIGGSRIFSALLQILVVQHGGGLTQMAMGVVVANLASYALQYVAYRRIASGTQLSMHLVSREAGRELFDYCLSLSIWSFAMLLVTGLDVALVGHFQFEAVASYAVAATLITFLAGLQDAVFKAMISPTAVMHARGDSSELGRVTITATRYGVFLLLLTGLPLILAAGSILTLWVGPTYAVHGAKILQILVVANMIRYSATPYVSALIGAGQQRLIIVTPLMEGVSNLFVSITAGYLFGAVGIALGTLFGSLVGVGGNFFYNMRRTTAIEFKIHDYVCEGLLRPLACAVPIIVCAAVARRVSFASPLSVGVLLTLAPLSTLLWGWRWGLSGNERDVLRHWLALSGITKSLYARR